MNKCIKKRGQIQSQTFMYILILLVIALLLFFGVKAIFGVISGNNDKQLITFMTTFEKDVQEARRSKGSIVHHKYALPRGFDDFCLLDTDADTGNSFFQENQLLKNLLEGNDNVVFLGDEVKSFHVDNIKLNFPDGWCNPTDKGWLLLSMSGSEGKTLIYTPPIEEYCRRAENLGLCDGLNIVFGPGYKQGCIDTFGLCNNDAVS